MEFADFVNNFKHILEESLEQFSKKHNLKYNYSYTVRDVLASFDVTLWYDEWDLSNPFTMPIDFTLENRKRGIVIKARAYGREVVITTSKSNKKIDRLKSSIIGVMEELLEKDLEEIEKILAYLEFRYKIKDILDKYPWGEVWYTIYIEIGKSEAVIHTEYRDGKMCPKEINIKFEKEEECTVFADFVEKSIDDIMLTVYPSEGVVSIDLRLFEPEERFDVLKKVIEALEMMYLF